MCACVCACVSDGEYLLSRVPLDGITNQNCPSTGVRRTLPRALEGGMGSRLTVWTRYVHQCMCLRTHVLASA